MKTNKWKIILSLCASITACDPEGEDQSWRAEDPVSSVEEDGIEDESDAIDHERIEEDAFGDEAVTEDVTANTTELFALPITVCGWECPPGYYKSGVTCSWNCPNWTPGCENASVCTKIP